MPGLESSDTPTSEQPDAAAPQADAAPQPPVQPQPPAASAYVPPAPYVPQTPAYTPQAPAYPAQPSAFVPPPAPHTAPSAQPQQPQAGSVPPSVGSPHPQPAQPAPPAASGKRSIAVPMIAAAVVAALLGGGVGAGVATWAVTSQQASPTSGPASQQTITIDNPDGTDVVTAVAAKAGNSVVTISVASRTAGGTGSGVILSDDGYVLTNTHVVTLDGESADGAIEVTTADGRLYSAHIVGLDPIVDLAVIKLDDASGLVPIEWGDSEALEVGDQVVAIGAPLGLANTVTDGIVSALGRSIQIASSAVPDSGDSDTTPDRNQNGGQGLFDFWQFGPRGNQQGRSSAAMGPISLPVIQTDAAINPGNSGGALLNGRGELVGVNVAIASTGSSHGEAGSIGVGFSIPASLAERVANEIIQTGEASHGLLGATVSTATSRDSNVVGAVIQSVERGGAAAEAGLRQGDVVTSFNGNPVTSSTDLTAQVRALAGGASAELSYQRGGTFHDVEVTLGGLEV